MIIAKIQTFPTPYSLQAGNPGCSLGVGDKGLPVADSLLAKVTTDQGLEGWGQAFGSRAVRSAKLAVEEADRTALVVAPLCTGKDSARKLRRSCSKSRRGYTYLRANWTFVLTGISAVDIAL